MPVEQADSPSARCFGKIIHTRDDAITEAVRLGYPVAPYKCPNGLDHWHVGNSQRNGNLFHNKREQWEDVAGNE
jgi:hypothetical protein